MLPYRFGESQLGALGTKKARNNTRYGAFTCFLGVFGKCQDPDLNWGHGDFQSPALPTELSRRAAEATQES